MRIVILIVGGALPLGVLAACAKPPKPAPAPVAAAVAPAPVCADFSFPVYFQTNSGQLADAASQVVADAAQRVRGCTLGRVDVVGLADADGSASRNLMLSRQRAAAVADALSRAGLPRPTFQVEGVGAAGAITPEGQPEPLRRRTEVVIRASPPSPAPPAAPARR